VGPRSCRIELGGWSLWRSQVLLRGRNNLRSSGEHCTSCASTGAALCKAHGRPCIWVIVVYRPSHWSPCEPWGELAEISQERGRQVCARLELLLSNLRMPASQKMCAHGSSPTGTSTCENVSLAFILMTVCIISRRCVEDSPFSFATWSDFKHTCLPRRRRSCCKEVKNSRAGRIRGREAGPGPQKCDRRRLSQM
jgi:hypothetical protein